MLILSSWFRLPVSRHVIKTPGATWSCPKTRSFADKHKPETGQHKQCQLQGTENEQRVRVRRARPSDVPRVLRFVRDNSRTTWPGLVAPLSYSQTVLCDYVTRALSQGHSMLAEQQESRRGWSQIRGLALGVAVCPWDAAMLERWARCVKSTQCKRLLHFKAHCLGAPMLHEKYQVHKILQVILIVPQNSPKSSEIVHILAKNAIQRGREVGFPILRFDVTEDTVAQALDKLKLNKEWQLSHDVLATAIKESDTQAEPPQSAYNTANTTDSTGDRNVSEAKMNENDNCFIVYTAFTDTSSTKE